MFFEHIYKKFKFIFTEKAIKLIKFTFRMYIMYFKLNFIPKNGHFYLFFSLFRKNSIEK